MQSKKFKTWEPLRIGDTVDIVAPGFSVSEEKLNGAVLFLKSLGLVPRVSKDIFGPDIICAQSDSIRLRLLHSAFAAKDSKAVWCIRGGYGMIRIIRDFAKFKDIKKPKLFIGYSDATTLHNYLNQFLGWPTLHGPLLDRLGQHDLPLEQVNEIVDVVFGNREQIVFHKLVPLNSAARKKKKIVSSVVGGNLSVTQTHLGTPFCKKPKGQILFFEDTGERGYRVDKMLKQLELAGYFSGVKAIVFGEFIGGEEKSGASLVPQVLERFAKEQKIPVFGGIEAGHGQQQRVVPFNTKATLLSGEAPSLVISTGASS